MPDVVVGQRFSRWTVIGESFMRGKYRYVRCQCECGVTKDVAVRSIAKRLSQSCGCLIGEVAAQTSFKHGGKGTGTYHVWKHMRQRCQNPKCKDYPNYGGRGIAICQRWNSFELFLQDMGPRPAGSTIERVDNEGGYCPENCIWQPREKQNQNKRSNRVLDHKGESHTLAEWGRITKIPARTIQRRLFLGWSVARALSEPIHYRGQGDNHA